MTAKHWKYILFYCCLGYFLQQWKTVDLKKLRLNKDGSIQGYGDHNISPEMEDFQHVHGQRIPGFCCATFPIAKGIARTIKRL